MRRSTTLRVPICLLAWTIFSADLAAADPVVWRLLQAPREGLVIARVDSAGCLIEPHGLVLLQLPAGSSESVRLSIDDRAGDISSTFDGRIGTHDQPATVIHSWQQRLPVTVSAVLSPESVHHAITVARQAVPNGDTARAVHARQVAWATRLEMAGRFDEALAALTGNLPADWKSLSAGDLHLVLQHAKRGRAVAKSVRQQIGS